jgi:hypothetical protein
MLVDTRQVWSSSTLRSLTEVTSKLWGMSQVAPSKDMATVRPGPLSSQSASGVAITRVGPRAATGGLAGLGGVSNRIVYRWASVDPSASTSGPLTRVRVTPATSLSPTATS